MKTAHYIGDHAKDGLLARAGWRITRAVQKGEFANTTHSEAIHAEHSDGTVTIASSSLRDGGVRDKRVTLNQNHWRIVDVPAWSVDRSIDLLFSTRGQPYDLRGAISTAFIGSPQYGRFFCNQWVGLPFIKAPATFGRTSF